MQIQGSVAHEEGLTISIQGMLTYMAVLNTHMNNISHFGLPGFQRKQPVTTSFAEVIGKRAVQEVLDTSFGRLRQSGNPLDVCINGIGYLQRMHPNGNVELTRDGRMKLDAQGNLLSVDGKQILSSAGVPIQFSIIPGDLEKEVKITNKGEILVYSSRSGKMTSMGKLGIAAQDGSLIPDAEIQQGYVEDANVMLQNEFVQLMPNRRLFEANRQLFIIQNDTLTKSIQELGRPT
jgi:flagellar basal body rod protein FlgG